MQQAALKACSIERGMGGDRVCRLPEGDVGQTLVRLSGAVEREVHLEEDLGQENGVNEAETRQTCSSVPKGLNSSSNSSRDVVNGKLRTKRRPVMSRASRTLCESVLASS